MTTDGLAAGPGDIKALHGLPMPTNVSQPRSLWGALSYYRAFLPRVAAKSKPRNALLGKDVKFVFTAEHVAIVQDLLKRLVSLEVVAFPVFKAAIL